MSKKKQTTQEYLLMHSRAKVDLLGTYLDRYLNIIANTHVEKIHVFDLFSAEGIYKNGGQGSPLVILSKVRELHAINSGKNSNIPSIEIVFNDIDKDKIETLKKNISKLDLDEIPNTNIIYRSKDYREIIKVLPSYFQKKKSEKFFIFIDPYGYKEIEMRDIKKLMECKNVEVLLFQPTQFMFRFESSATIPSSLEKFIEEIMPEKKSEYTSIDDFIESMKVGFRQFIGNNFFVDTFTIQRDSNTVFCLFFFTSHIRGFEKMLEAKWELDKENGKGWKYERTFDIFNQDNEINILEKELFKYLVYNRNNIELYEFALSKGFLPKHANDVLKFLQKQNKLCYFDNNGNPLKKNSFYITYENYRNREIKGVFKLN